MESKFYLYWKYYIAIYEVELSLIKHNIISKREIWQLVLEINRLYPQKIFFYITKELNYFEIFSIRISIFNLCLAIIWRYMKNLQNAMNILISLYIYENLPSLKKNCFPSKMLQNSFLNMCNPHVLLMLTI